MGLVSNGLFGGDGVWSPAGCLVEMGSGLQRVVWWKLVLVLPTISLVEIGSGPPTVCLVEIQTGFPWVVWWSLVLQRAFGVSGGDWVWSCRGGLGVNGGD